ncbi:MAG: hypothetical protein ACFHX7_05225 [Pseudomonadota bacterium]
MSGENALAKKLVSEALIEANNCPSMNPDSLALAILSQSLRVLSETRSRADLESYIDYDLDNLIDSDMVITRGC